jgi:hypothetical protein
MKNRKILLGAFLLAGIVLFLISAPASYAKAGPGDPGPDGKKVMLVTAESADAADLNVFSALWNWFFGDVSRLNPDYPRKSGADLGMIPKRSCGGENGCIMVTDRP